MIFIIQKPIFTIFHHDFTASYLYISLKNARRLAEVGAIGIVPWQKHNGIHYTVSYILFMYIIYITLYNHIYIYIYIYLSMVIHGIHDYQSLMNGYQCFLVRQSDLFKPRMVNIWRWVKTLGALVKPQIAGYGRFWSPYDPDPSKQEENNINGMDIQLYTVISGGDPIFIYCIYSYTVIPPSKHGNGKQYKWNVNRKFIYKYWISQQSMYA